MLLVLLALVWVRSPLTRRAERFALLIVPVTAPPLARQREMLGAFRLTGTWQLLSNWRYFGGYSALIDDGEAGLIAISDTGHAIAFARPDRPWFAPQAWGLTPAPAGVANDMTSKADRDFESASHDAISGRTWIGAEFSNRILRFDADWHFQTYAAPRAMASWPTNTGPESMVRLKDGRFIVLCECTRQHSLNGDRHDGLLFRRDPIASSVAPIQFEAEGPWTFRPVDMAQLPDGRVLVLLRRLVWPMPQRFAGRLMIGDPADIRAGGTWRLRQVASLGSALDGDNFEGMAIEPAGPHRVLVWLISDDNQSRLQRTLLWRLEVDPARL